MPMRKIAISIPEAVLEAVDDMAARRNESRSRLIATILSRLASAKRDREIAARIDALFEDDTIREDQLRVAESFRSIGGWRDESW